ncbi:hypothetical protein Asp14428_73830 [Actinoplanes sp. NBRC 14428]|nr:hypothetical protein Asp14428_73830 [Actinoplanes sp. NBRC 14428]
MRIKSPLPALVVAVGLAVVAVSLLNAHRIGAGLIVGIAASVAVHRWARRRADVYLAGLQANHAMGSGVISSRPRPLGAGDSLTRSSVVGRSQLTTQRRRRRDFHVTRYAGYRECGRFTARRQ